MCFISFYQSHSALYAAAMVSALRYDPFLRSIAFHRNVFLISPETQEWLNGFYIALLGMGVWVRYSFVYDTIRSIMAKRALKGYQICSTERLNALCLQCAEIVRLKKSACTILGGTLDNPICVTGRNPPSNYHEQNSYRKADRWRIIRCLYP